MRKRDVYPDPDALDDLDALPEIMCADDTEPPVCLDELLDELIAVCCACDHQWAHQLRRWRGQDDTYTLARCEVCPCSGGREQLLPCK